MIKIDVCPGTLANGFSHYSPSCIKYLFDGVNISHILDFDYSSDGNDFINSINRISISGVQEKISAVISKKKIIITPEGCHGRYIIKPAPNYKHLRFREFIPANEHLTMQIASQVYKIKTAENGIIFFRNGEMAYITKRFDYDKDGNKIMQEDFSSIAGKTNRTHGKDFKYSGSYEDAARLIRNNVAAWQIEMDRFFSLVIFNYIFANGDAHLKNFSLQQTPNGDYIMTPAYDLINTSLHINDGDFALQDGLIPTEEYSEIYSNSSHPCKEDFITFGNRIGVLPKKMNAIVEMFSKENNRVYELIEHSFLDDKCKRMYKRSYQERLQRFLRTS